MRVLLPPLRLVALFVPCVLGCDSMAQCLYSVDAIEHRCLNCSTQDESEMVLSAVGSRADLDIGGWLQQHVHPNDDYWNDVLRRDPIADTYSELFSGFAYETGVTFRLESGDLVYRFVPCKIFDCYKYYLARSNDAGEQMWRRRIPEFKLPVYPFLTESGIMFVGEKSDGTYLIVLDPATGKSLKEYRLPGEDIEFSPLNPLSTYPFYTDGSIVLQGCRVEYNQGWPKKVVPDDIVVLHLEDCAGDRGGPAKVDAE